ncbi:hypothetical protein [Actinokineospora cianjurensis]|uniref:Uncharacterized protein n=1 Tax=Actinokineospora cianjurensis TaxID=585224 RepID=A0A421B3L5_9PSEU|nr:hypothetical protein [Actinokineospora cianjurensis]RLK58969.1 hypothetical protein CLV68_3450 [Actinokineospora cianjurensis]
MTHRRTAGFAIHARVWLPDEHLLWAGTTIRRGYDAKARNPDPRDPGRWISGVVADVVDEVFDSFAEGTGGGSSKGPVKVAAGLILRSEPGRGRAWSLFEAVPDDWVLWALTGTGLHAGKVVTPEPEPEPPPVGFLTSVKQVIAGPVTRRPQTFVDRIDPLFTVPRAHIRGFEAAKTSAGVIASTPCLRMTLDDGSQLDFRFTRDDDEAPYRRLAALTNGVVG